MSQSLVLNTIHLVYSTKKRQRWIVPELREEFHRYQATLFKTAECPAIAIGSQLDHVHALFHLSKNRPLSMVVQEIKASSSAWLKSKGRDLAGFQWQAGYSAFSVSKSNVDRVARYIENQDLHHRETSFQDELLLLLTKHGIDFDERYL